MRHHNGDLLTSDPALLLYGNVYMYRTNIKHRLYVRFGYNVDPLLALTVCRYRTWPRFDVYTVCIEILNVDPQLKTYKFTSFDCMTISDTANV